MSISIGPGSATSSVPPPRLDLLARGIGPVGPSERLPDGTITVFRDLFGEQIDRLPKDRLRIWDGYLQPETKGQPHNGTIFYSQQDHLWHAVVWPDRLKREANAFPNPKGFEDAVKAQEAFHALTFPAMSRPDTEVGGELVSLKVYGDYFIYPMQHVLNHVQGRSIKGYEKIYHVSLHALGTVAEKYGLFQSGSTIENGRQLMQDFIRSGATAPNRLTFDFLRDYARKNFSLRSPEQFVGDLRQAFLGSFSAATRQILGEPGQFRVR